jgi:hypothetical protein
MVFLFGGEGGRLTHSDMTVVKAKGPVTGLHLSAHQ